MKKYNFMIGLIILSINLFAQERNKEWTEEYIQHNIAFTNIKARVITSDFYICEITVTDLSKSLPMPMGFGLNGQTFADNGVGNDLVRGDGVYSSTIRLNF